MQFEKWYDIDLKKPRQFVPDIGFPTFEGDNNSVRIGVNVFSDKAPSDVAGTIKGYCILPNGVALMPWDGAKDGNRAWIDVPDDALIMNGRITLSIRCFDADETTVLFQASATVRRVDSERHYDPEDEIGDVTDLIEEAERVSGVAAQAAQDAQDALAQASDIVSYATQTGQTDAQKATARGNIEAASEQDVSDLKNAVNYEENGVNWWKSNDSVFYALADNKRNILRHIRDIKILTNSLDLQYYIYDAETLSNGNIYLHFSAKRNGTEIATKAVTLPVSSTATTVSTTWNNANSVIDVLYDTDNVAASTAILNTTSYIAVNERCVIRTDTELNTAYVPADSKAVGDRFTATETALAGEIARIESKITEYATKYDWKFFASDENPTGWRIGNYTTDGSANSQAFYLRTLDGNNIVQTIPGARRFTITAPEGYAVAACEYDISGAFVKRYGDNDIRNATATRSVSVDVKHGYNYKFTIGRWANSDASSYLTTEFISDIELIVYGKYDYDYIQPYYFPYLDNKVKEINEISNSVGNSTFGFVFITDFHYLRNALQSPKLIKYIMQKTGVHMVIFGGDAFQGWKDQADQNKYTDYVYTLLSGCGETDYYCVTGNHEWEIVGGNNNTQAGVNAITTNRVRNRVIKMDQYGDYYIDDVMSGTRIFFLSCDASGSIPWNSIYWLGDNLLEVPSGYNVMLIAHAGILNNGTQKNTYLNCSKLLSAFDASEPVDLYDSDNVFRRRYDYTGKSGTSICYLCGHTHEDLQIPKSGTNGTLLICTTGDLYKDASGNHYTFVDEQGQTITRNVGTIYEQAFDVIQIDPTAKKIYCTRVGAGLDREFSY